MTGNTNIGAIGDRVWIDADGDGFQDPEKPGRAVSMSSSGHDTDGVGTVDAHVLDDTATTDAAGNYIFDELTAGVYEVRIPTRPRLHSERRP